MLTDKELFVIINTERERRKTMQKMREEVIRRFGFEAEVTVMFCISCEDFEDGIISFTELKKEYDALMR